MKNKLISFILALCLLIAIPLEARYKYNPFTRKLDYYETGADIDLGDLADVTLTGLATGNVLYYDGSAWVNLTIGANTQVLTLAAGIPAWQAIPAGVTTFVGLNDTPANYVGKAGQLVRVNAVSDGLEFFAGSAAGTVIVADGSGGWTKDENFNIVSGKVSAGGYEGTAIANAYIAGIDQDLLTSSSPSFGGITVTNAITEFSTDGTLGDDSDSALPSEKAVKLYVDTLFTGSSNYAFKTITGITNDIIADNSYDTLVLAVGNPQLTIVGTVMTDTIIFTVVVGTADAQVVIVDDAAGIAAGEYCKFTASGVEARTTAEVLSDLSGQAGAAFSWNSKNLTSVGKIDGPAVAPLILNDTIAQNVELFVNTAGNPLFKIWGKDGEPNSWGSLQVDNTGQFRFNATNQIYFDTNTYSIEDVHWYWGDAADYAVISQSAIAGTEDQPLIYINDDRTGATATELSESTIVIDAEGVYGFYVKDGKTCLDDVLYLSYLAAGRIPFVGISGEIKQNANFYWYDANERLGIGAIGSAPANPLVVYGAGTSVGGAPPYTDVVAFFRNTIAAKHTAISINALVGYDAALYFGDNMVAVWDIRNDASGPNDFQIRYQVDAANIIYFQMNNSGDVEILEGDFSVTMDAALDQIVFAQSSGTGTEDQPLILIDDDRADMNEIGEAALVIDSAAVFGLYVKDGDVWFAGGNLTLATSANLYQHDDLSIYQGSGNDVRTIWAQNGAGDDLLINAFLAGGSNTTVLTYATSTLTISGMTDHDDYVTPTFVLMNNQGADAGDYAGVVIGERAQADVKVAHYFDFYAMTGAGDGSVNSDNAEIGATFRFGDAGSAVPDHATGPGDVLFEDDIEVDGVSYFGDATNYASFAADGTLTLAGTARPSICFQFANASLGSGGTKPDEILVGNYWGWSYDIADDSVFTIKLPDDWAAGTDAEIHIRWAIDEAYAADSGEVRWQATWSAHPADMSEAINDAGTTDASPDVNIPATAYFLTQTLVETIPGGSLAAGDEIGITIERIALVDGNDPTADPVITCVGFIYTADKLGL